MITDSLYTTAQTVTVGKQDEQYDVLKTGTLNSSSGGVTINDFSSYWLGYITYTNVPMRCHPSIAYFDEDQNLHFEDVIDEANFPCGYCDDNYGVNSEGYYDVLMQNTINGITTTTTTNQIRLLNDNYPEYSGLNYTGGLIDDSDGVLHFVYAKYDAGDNYLSGLRLSGADYTFSNVSPTSNRIKKMYDVIINDEEISLTIENEIVKCRLSDFENGTPESLIISESGNYKFRLFLTLCYIPHGCGLNNNTRVNVAGTYMVKTTGYGGTIEIVRSLRGLNTQVIRNTAINGYTQANPYKILWGCNGIFSAEELRIVGNYPAYGGRPFTWGGNLFVERRSSGTSELQFWTMIFAEDVRRVFSLHYRVDTSSGFTPSYVRGVTYATDVNKNTNEFYARLKTGNIEDDAFKNTLAPWQYTNFAANNFNEEKIPPYTPPPIRPDPEDPGDLETDGDEIELNDPTSLGNGFGFTTMYAIRASHLQEIGNKLWSGFDNVNNYIENFEFNVDPSTGSVNFEDIMSFFISLRAYPCPISAMTTTSGGGTDMYIGSGAAPLSLTTPFSVVDSYVGQINAGSVTIPFWYGDYRDYDLQITCYLPYCGTIQLNPGDVMGGTLSATYILDFCSGACTAYVVCQTWEGKRILVGSMPGQIGADIPMTATNAGRVMARMYGDRIDVAQNILNGVKSIGMMATGTVGGAISGITGVLDAAMESERHFANMGSRGAITCPVLPGGNGLAAMGTSKTAFVQIRSPYYVEPENYGHTAGKPAVYYDQLRSFSGYTECYNVDVRGIHCTEEERAAIKSILETGCYL